MRGSTAGTAKALAKSGGAKSGSTAAAGGGGGLDEKQRGKLFMAADCDGDGKLVSWRRGAAEEVAEVAVAGQGRGGGGRRWGA